MVAGAKTQPWIQNDHPLARTGLTPAPTGFDQEPFSNLNRMEMAFPRFGPVFPSQWPDNEPGLAQIELQPSHSFQSVLQTGAQCSLRAGQRLRVRGDDNLAGLFAPVCRRLLAKSSFQQAR